MRYLGPKHIGEIFLASGPRPVIDGVLELPNDASSDDTAAAYLLGFRLVETKPEAKPAPASSKL